MSIIRNTCFAAALALLFPLAASAHHTDSHGKGDIKIESAYSRAMLPVAKVGGGYLTIINAGSDDRLVSAKSERAGEVQIHEMKMDGGVMEMRELKDGIPVPARSTLELKPGGYHLMFMSVDKPFKEGETVKATLVFEKAGPVDVDLEVGPVAGGHKPDAAHEGHGQPDAHTKGAHDHRAHGK